MTDTPKRRTIASSRKPVAAQSTIAPKRIMTVTEGRGIAIEIGICIFDLNSCEATLCQLADSQTLTRTLQKIDLNEPQKILMPVYATDTDNPMTSKLSKLTELQFPHISIITLARKYFDDEQGKRYIQEYGLQEDVAGLLFGIATKYYCLAAISGAFRHIFETEGYRFAPHTIKFTYQGAEDTMMIDTITAKNLELVANTNSNTTRNTLLHVLDRTLTPMGRRLLRMNILQPPCSLEIIKDRLDVVQELSKSEETIFNLQTCLKHMIDMDHTIAYIVKLPNTTKKSSLVIQQAEIKTNQVIGLKQTIKAIRSIAA
ncbi:MutS protein msh4, partial [Rhizopus stolonifer]